ncbi:GNAT family N-acetyltransferase [Bacillus sp. P14.5]|uniref:GNAT family N-acetyltransferase n=1 Tax=Bacillus sp. P14.5 TaxID=1983400 RepID=UPI0013B04AA9|nr:GNAT family N-acetyltransferase [Bacillus sp. P14.5]
MTILKMRAMNEGEVDRVAEFISHLNREKASHIGYCGQDSKEIAYSIRNDITDLSYMDSFLVAYDQDELVAVLGFDADIENNSAEIWGPFFKGFHIDVLHSMWNRMIELIPDQVHSLRMFPNKKNVNVLTLAEELGFVQKSVQTILSFDRKDMGQVSGEPFQEITPEYYSAMKELHNKIFPESYYNGSQIIERMIDYNKVMITSEGGRLTGYIYAEAEPEFGEASLEFFAVDESARGKGIGARLISQALNWLFLFDSMHSVTLCVDSANEKALRLYTKMGFKKEHELVYLIKNSK